MIHDYHNLFSKVNLFSDKYFWNHIVLGKPGEKTMIIWCRKKQLAKLSFALYNFLILGIWHFFWFMLLWLAAFTSKRTTLEIPHTYNCDICVSEIRTNLNGACKLIIFVANSAFLHFVNLIMKNFSWWGKTITELLQMFRYFYIERKIPKLICLFYFFHNVFENIITNWLHLQNAC